MKITSWNVNSVKSRLPNLLSWLEEARPDVVLLQELKCLTEAFPREAIEDLGYNLAIHGQKTYNGAIGVDSTMLKRLASNSFKIFDLK